jgi:hypothetical protein
MATLDPLFEFELLFELLLVFCLTFVLTVARFTRVLFCTFVVVVVLLVRFAAAGGANASMEASATPAMATRNLRMITVSHLESTLLDAKASSVNARVTIQDSHPLKWFLNVNPGQHIFLMCRNNTMPIPIDSTATAVA